MTRGRRSQPVSWSRRYDVAVEGGREHTRHTDIMSWVDGGAARRLEKVIYSRTAFSAGSNFFFYPTILPDQGPAAAPLSWRGCPCSNDLTGPINSALPADQQPTLHIVEALDADTIIAQD